MWQYRNRTAQDRGIVRILVLLTSFLCLGALASKAVASDVNIRGSVNQTLTASDNYFLSNTPLGWTYQSYTNGTLDFLARTPDTQYLLNTNYSYFNYYGPGAQETTLRWGAPASARFSIDHTTLLDKYNLALSWTRSDIQTTLLAQTGQFQNFGTSGGQRGFLQTFSATGGVTHDVSRIDTVRWQAAASTNQSDDPSFTSYNDFNSSLIWTRPLSPTMTFTSSLYFDWFSQDDPAQSQRLLWTLSGTLSAQVTHRFTVNGSVSELFVNSWQNNPGAASNTNLGFAFTPFTPLTGAGHALNWNAGFNYRLLKTTNVSMSFAEAIAPVITGQLQKSRSMSLAVSHQINNASSLSLIASVTQAVTSTSPQSQFFSAGVIYSYRLARDWNANLSYTYRQREDPTSGFVNGNTFLFGLNYSFNAMGKPGAFKSADTERARLRAQQAVGYVFPGYVGLLPAGIAGLAQ